MTHAFQRWWDDRLDQHVSITANVTRADLQLVLHISTTNQHTHLVFSFMRLTKVADRNRGGLFEDKTFAARLPVILFKISECITNVPIGEKLLSDFQNLY